MALKREDVEKFFIISQQHAAAQKKSLAMDVDSGVKAQIDQSIKTSHKPNTNITQTQHKHHTNITQISDTIPYTNYQQTKKPNTETDTQIHTNPTQTSHKHNTNATKDLSFDTLVGNLKKIILYIYYQCKFNGKYEIILSITTMASAIQIPSGSVNTSLVRLEKKGYIQKIASQPGRGGWKKIKLAEYVYKEMVFVETSHRLSTNLTQTSLKPNTELNTEPNTTVSSSSSKDLYKTTTTEQAIPSKPEGPQLPDEWLAIDIEPLRSINFTHMHLSQLATEEQLTPKIVQQSIDFFAFDLSNNNKAKTIKISPLNFFMGILRNRGGYAVPDNYGSPEERYMKDYAKKIRQQGEEMAKLENEAIELSFKSWYVILPDQEKIKLIPGTNISKLKDDPYKFTGKKVRRLAREYFKDVVWPNIRERVMAGEVLVDEYKEIDTDKQVYGILDLLRDEAAIKALINPAP